MNQLFKQKKVTSFKMLHIFTKRFIYAAMVAFYVSFLIEESFKFQLAYIVLFVVISLLMDYLSENSKPLVEISIDDGVFKLLNVDIDVSTVTQILYSQSKRFEHTIRFQFENNTYRDFELSDSSLIDDLRFYYFLVDNKLPVKMLDNEDRLM